MLPDDGPSGISRAMNYSRNGARPPTMIEQKLAGGAVSFNTPPPMPNHPYGYGSYQSFSPGQVMNPYTPTTSNSANPFFSPYGESPIGSPVSVPVYDSHYDAQGNLVSRKTSLASMSVPSRHTSIASKPAEEPSAHADVDGQYVDMSRGSVTPFQAAQYAEISRRLNTTPPQPLPLSSVNEEYEHAQEIEVSVQKVEPLELQPTISFDEGHRLNVQPTPRENAFPESPFYDPSMAQEQTQYIPKRGSSDSMMLQPPEPARPRIASIPPMLPEITLQERSFSPVTMDFPIAPSSVHMTPSPFTTSFAIPSPPPNAHFPESVEDVKRPVSPPAAQIAQPTLRQPPSKRPDTVYTIYDEEDAYAGI